jgi:asparagine synthase (glutamine-hydrolysing)
MPGYYRHPEESAKALAKLVQESVAASVGGEAVVAVAFSGGLDSSVIAKCAAGFARVVACTAFAPGSGDKKRAQAGAVALGVDLVSTELTEDGVARDLASIDLPFQPTLMDKSLWCLYSNVARSAKVAGAKVLLLGQMADELFGGYAKYVETLDAHGKEAAARMMEADAREYAGRGRVRDVAACGTWVEARFPFEASGIQELAAAMPMDFKIRDGVRKAVLRRSAELLGVPEELARSPKKAAQYSSGVQKLVAASHF